MGSVSRIALFPEGLWRSAGVDFPRVVISVSLKSISPEVVSISKVPDALIFILSTGENARI